ncbi:MAG: hypothetical protein A2148_00295 [Chloroflexi bacterium RBG_16_68_14]|nr:MAG: hypothetical protein A2148_00295 [Chloroflexi bacterium RBG_16_68_14]
MARCDGWRQRVAGLVYRPSLVLLPLAALAGSLALLPPTASASPGWELVLDRPSPSFGGIDFVSETEGWLVAGAGLLHTTDGGATWEEAAPLTGIDVDFADADHGWLVGYNGTIYATQDGGESWANQASGVPNMHLRDIAAISAGEAWAVGIEAQGDVPRFPAQTALLHTTDGGVSWLRVETPPSSWFEELQFVGEHGWALGWAHIPCDEPDCPAGPQTIHRALLRTLDGGGSWELMTEGLPQRIGRLSFLDDTHGWAIGRISCDQNDCLGAILETRDGGLNWTESFFPLGSFVDVTFVTDLEGWALMRDTEAPPYRFSLAHTIDAGLTWTFELVGGLSAYQPSLTVGEGITYLTGNDLALSSADGGVTWQTMEHPAIAFDSTSFLDGRLGHAVGRQTLYRTSDGGRTWRALSRSLAFHAIVRFIDANVGVIAERERGASGALTVGRTTDGGSTWEEVHRTDDQSLGFPRKIYLEDEQRGWILMDAGLLITSDGGATWQERRFADPATIPGPDGIDAVTLDEVWRIVYIPEPDRPDPLRLQHSTDGGATWHGVPTQAELQLEFVDFVDTSYGWYEGTICQAECRSLLFRTTDGGRTWEEIDLAAERVLDLTFTDRMNGWLNVARCSDSGCGYQVLHTDDGGRSWTTELEGEELSGDFDFVDSANGWLLLYDPASRGVGTEIPSRTVLYHRTGEGAPVLPDVGYGPSRGPTRPLALPALLATMTGLALLAAGALALGRGRRAYSQSPS